MHFVDYIVLQSRFSPLSAALFAPGAIEEIVTYSRLVQMIASVASRVRDLGIQPGKSVLLNIADPVLHFSLIFGLSKLGITTASTNPYLDQIDISFDLTITDNADFAMSRNAILAGKDWLSSRSARIEDFSIDLGGEDWPVKIVFTSGTTGHVKAVPWSMNQIIFSTQNVPFLIGGKMAFLSRIFVDMSLTSTPGFLTSLAVLMRGGTVALAGKNILDTVRFMAIQNVQGLVAGIPLLSALTRIADQTPTFPAQIEAIVTMGDFISPVLAERIRSRLSPNVISIYGTAEVGIIASCPINTLVSNPGAAGFLAPGIEVSVLDEDGKTLPKGRSGRICVRTPHMFEQYLFDGRSHTSQFSPHGFCPGDIGSIDDRGFLSISGRENAVLNFGGNKVHAEVIERALKSYDKVADAGAFVALSDDGYMKLFAAVVWDEDPDVSGLQDHLNSVLLPLHRPEHLLSLKFVPRNRNGKINRIELARMSVEEPHHQAVIAPQ